MICMYSVALWRSWRCIWDRATLSRPSTASDQVWLEVPLELGLVILLPAQIGACSARSASSGCGPAASLRRFPAGRRSVAWRADATCWGAGLAGWRSSAQMASSGQVRRHVPFREQVFCLGMTYPGSRIILKREDTKWIRTTWESIIVPSPNGAIHPVVMSTSHATPLKQLSRTLLQSHPSEPVAMLAGLVWFAIELSDSPRKHVKWSSYA